MTDLNWNDKSYVHPDVEFARTIQLTIPKIPNMWLQGIISAYNEPWRHYHNRQHILKMLGMVSLVTFSSDQTNLKDRLPLREQLRALKAMIIFHDVIYKINREKGWSEKQSAEFSYFCLADSDESVLFRDVVNEGILATATHQLNDVSVNFRHLVSWLLDIDLNAGIGNSQTEFQDNTLAIQREFSPTLTKEEYATGRAKWAKSMLERERIYHTTHFSSYEADARTFLKSCVLK